MSGRLAIAAAYVAELTSAGVAATLDAREAAANRPCVLVPPPTIDHTTASTTWRLIALARNPLGSLDSWAEIDALVDAVDEVLCVERAEPITYVLPGVTGAEPLPAYAITVTGGI